MGYFPGAANPLNVPHYLKARTAEMLKRAMVQNNLNLRGYCNYFDIQFVDGYWYAWYIIDVGNSRMRGQNGSV